jgi:hypothetical protein
MAPQPELEAGERVVWQKRCSLTVRIGVGGVLYVTTSRLLFVPGQANYKRDRAPRWWPLDQIASVGIARPDWSLYTGGVHSRLRLRLRTGDSFLFNFGFNFDHLTQTAKDLQAAIPGSTLAAEVGQPSSTTPLIPRLLSRILDRHG